MKKTLNSSAIKSASFVDGSMIVEFHRGACYAYSAPVSVFYQLVTAESAGRFFSAYVRRQYTGTKL